MDNVPARWPPQVSFSRDAAAAQLPELLSAPLWPAGALFQSRFSSGLLSSLPDSPLLRPEAPRSSPWVPPAASSFLLPPKPTEPPVRTVGVRRLGGPIPMEESVTQGKARGRSRRAVTCSCSLPAPQSIYLSN